MRKILIIIIGIVGILIIGGLIYYFAFRSTPTAPQPATGPLTLAPGATPATSTEGLISPLKLLSSEPVFDYWVASSTQEIFYVTAGGKIAKVGSPANTYLSEQSVENLNFILPSPDNQKIIFAFGDSRQPQFSIFDLTSNFWTPLPLEIKSLAFSPEGKRLAALISQNNQTNLAIIDLKAKILKTLIKNFALQDLKIDWLRPEEIIFSEKPSALTLSSAWRLNISKLNFTEIISPGRGLLLRWLKDDLGLKFQNSESSLINWAGQVINELPFLALPDKCVFKSDALYCFLFSSGNLSRKTNWPDDYLQGVIYTKDDFYKIDLNNLAEPQLIFNQWGGKAIDATNLKIFGNQILFLNRYDNNLYGLEL
jgi:hypothetical protein